MNFIDGIELLNVTKDFSAAGSTFILLGTALFILGITLLIISALDIDIPYIILSVIMIVFGIIFVYLGAKTHHPIYAVTVQDNVNFTEFYEKYEVVKQEGKIYYIIEREAD